MGNPGLVVCLLVLGQALAARGGQDLNACAAAESATVAAIIHRSTGTLRGGPLRAPGGG